MLSIQKVNNNLIKQQVEKTKQTFINAKRQVLEELLAEIEREDYETINQIKGSIHSTLVILTRMEKGGSHE